MIKLAAISPKTMMSADAGVNSPEEAQLKELFSQMAYSMLESKMPNLVPSIQSFKVIKVDLEGNRGVGAFSIGADGKSITVPVLMSEGKVVPPEVFYSPESATYMPLSDEWIAEASKPTGPDIGVGSKGPKSLSKDMDIRAVTLPPTTGRFVYASHDSLLDVIESSSDETKAEILSVFKKSSAYRKEAIKYYGPDFVEVLRPLSTKVASSKGPEVHVLDPTSGAAKFREVFGGNSELAYKTACKHGVAIRDLRKEAAVPLKQESLVNSQVATGVEELTNGVYNLLSRDGKSEPAIVISRPVDTGVGIFNRGDSDKSDSVTAGSSKHPRYLLIHKDGSHSLVHAGCCCLDPYRKNMHGMRLASPAQDILGSKLPSGESAPKNGDTLFVKIQGGQVANAALLPRPLSGLTEVSKGHYEGMSGMTRVVITSSKGVNVPKKVGDVLYIPYSYRSMRSKTRPTAYLDGLVGSPEGHLKALNHKVASYAEDHFRVTRTLDGSWSLDGKQQDSYSSLVKQAAVTHSVNANLLNKSALNLSKGQSFVYSVVPAEKVASIFGPEPAMPPPGAMPPPPPGMPQETAMSMEAAAGLGDKGMFDAATLGALTQMNPLNEAISNELPNVEKALDSVARILVSVQMRSSELISQLGPDDYSELEDNLRTTLSGLGSIILSVHKQRNLQSLPESLV